MRTRRTTTGFSLIELVLILVLIGALAVFAAPRLNIGGFDDYTFRQEVVNALRYAQKTAAASRCEVEVAVAGDQLHVRVRSGGTASTCGDGGFTEYLRHPSRGGDFVVQARRDAGVESGGSVIFDERGASASGLQIEFTGGRVIAVEPATGYVHG